ncbi:MAG: type VI secretion system lipoprotein TssJ [Gammaproteobacteria bacterium]|nr:MAG: type VI secretion system lipoprotein TssJ [Gammaproteobacteria bacterium]
MFTALRKRTFFSITMIASLLMVIFTTGCSTTARVLNLQTEVSMNFQVWPNINPDEAGRSSPLVIRVFELKDARQFQTEDFIGLFQESRERLGGDLVAERRLRELTPGIDHQEVLLLDPTVRYIGLLAEFVQYENAQARLVFPVEPHRTTEKIIWVNKTTIQVVDEERPKNAD